MSAASNTSPRSYPGYFITFEGGDSCGKTTQIELLADELRAYYQAVPLPEAASDPAVARALNTAREVILTREPGGTEVGQQLRKLVLHGPDDIDDRCEALLYAADRAYHAENLLRPALASGAVVLCDRFVDSSVAYQGAGRNLGVEKVRELNEWAVRGLEPDLTFILDIDPQVAAERRGGVHDRLEKQARAFHDATRAQYLRIAKEAPQRCVVLDATRAISDIADDVWTELLSRTIVSGQRPQLQERNG